MKKIVLTVVATIAFLMLLGYAYNRGKIDEFKRCNAISYKVYGVIDWAKAQNENPELMQQVLAIGDKAKADINAHNGKADDIADKAKKDITVARLSWLYKEARP